MANQYVVFQLAHEFYAVDIAQVRGIEKLLPLTRVPHAPSFVQGVANLRGRVIPIIDLGKRLSLPTAVEGKNARVLIVNVGKYTVGMTIDNANDVVTISPADIEPSPSLVTGIDTEFVRGVARISNRLLIILDLEKILTINQVNQLESLR